MTEGSRGQRGTEEPPWEDRSRAFTGTSGSNRAPRPERRAAACWGRAWERSGLASPYLACGGAFCCGSGARWAQPPRGRPCSAVTSAASRRWPQSPELTNLPCPERAEVAGARGAPQRTAQGSRTGALPPAAPLCYAPLVSLRLAPGVSTPCRQWDVFHRRSGRPRESACHFPPGGAGYRAAQERPAGLRSELLPGSSGPWIPAPHLLPLPAPPRHPHSKLPRIGRQIQPICCNHNQSQTNGSDKSPPGARVGEASG